ncbi:MAG: YggT family protein [Firmicutes bacterium]|nr:YggT family protein [Bacillota bacterium]
MDENQTNKDMELTKVTSHVETVKKVEPSVGNRTIIIRVIWYIAGLLLILLGFRFVLALLGANLQNGFANFIFSITHPFVLPFFGLFNYTPTYGVVQFEASVLVAMAVYALVAWGITKLVNITRSN